MRPSQGGYLPFLPGFHRLAYPVLAGDDDPLNMPDFSLQCFGVGDGWPSPDRGHSSFLYRIGKTTVLIDCGECVSRSFKETGLDYDTIDAIVISHLHADHIGGFFMLMQGFWLERRKKDLPIYLPRDGIRPVREMLKAAFLFDELFGFKPTFTALEAGQPWKVDKVKLRAFPTTHLFTLRAAFRRRYPQTYAAYCFLIEAGKLRVGHTADVGQPEDLDPLLEKPLDLLVCELTHFKPKDLFNYLRGRPVKQILFVHVGRHYWEKLGETRRLAEQLLGGIPFSFARDGTRLEL